MKPDPSDIVIRVFQLSSMIASLTRCVDSALASGMTESGPDWLKVAVARIGAEIAELLPSDSLRCVSAEFLDLRSPDNVAKSLHSLLDVRALLGLSEAALQELSLLIAEPPLRIMGFGPPPTGSSST